MVNEAFNNGKKLKSIFMDHLQPLKMVVMKTT